MWHDYSYLGPKAADPDTARSVTRNLRNLPISAPLREKFQYCNLMFTVATHLSETVAGVSFADFLHAHFFPPLGMNSSHLQPDAAIAAGLQSRIATPYHWDEDKGTYIANPIVPGPEAQGTGSIFTSVEDYLRYVKAFMNHEPPISEKIYEGLTTARIVEDPEEGEDRDPSTFLRWAYATGWQTRTYRGVKIVDHDGMNYGFGSTHFFVPEYKIGGVILGNANGGTDLAPILAKEFVDGVLGAIVALINVAVQFESSSGTVMRHRRVPARNPPTRASSHVMV